jgi:hypothetical protein
MKARTLLSTRNAAIAAVLLSAEFRPAACGAPQVHGGAGVTVDSRNGVQVGAGLGVTVGSIPANGMRPRGYCTFRDRRTGVLYYAPCSSR